MQEMVTQALFVCTNEATGCTCLNYVYQCKSQPYLPDSCEPKQGIAQTYLIHVYQCWSYLLHSCEPLQEPAKLAWFVRTKAKHGSYLPHSCVSMRLILASFMLTIARADKTCLIHVYQRNRWSYLPDSCICQRRRWPDHSIALRLVIGYLQIHYRCMYIIDLYDSLLKDKYLLYKNQIYVCLTFNKYNIYVMRRSFAWRTSTKAINAGGNYIHLYYTVFLITSLCHLCFHSAI